MFSSPESNLIENCPLSAFVVFVNFQNSSSPELLQFQPNWRQGTLGWREYTFVQMKISQYSRVDKSEIVLIKIRIKIRLTTFKHFLIQNHLVNYNIFKMKGNFYKDIFFKLVHFLDIFFWWALWPVGLLFISLQDVTRKIFYWWTMPRQPSIRWYTAFL